MANILIRDLSEEVHSALIAAAEKNRRSKEKHAMYLIEQGLARHEAETCGELLDAYESVPAPKVDIEAIDSYMATRGRRSNRS